MTNSIQIIGSKGTGGAENFFVRLTKALQQDGGDVLAITPPDCPTSRQLEGFVTQTPVAMRGNWDIFSKYKIRKLVQESACPIVQTWMGRATRLTDLRGLPGVTHIARLGGYYNLKAYRHASAWVGNTRGICDYMVQQGLPVRKVFHIGNFFLPPRMYSQQELASIRQELKIEDDAQIIFSLGRFHINKAFDVLLQALGKMDKTPKGRPCYLLLAGDGPLRLSLSAMAKSLGLESRVKWLGWVDDPARYFQLADVFVCPSRHEPLGNVVLEAWGNETAVIACNIQGPAELISDGENGILIENENVEQLAAQMSLILSQPEIATGLAKAGKQTLESKYSCEKITRDYQQLYTDLSSQ